MPSTVLSCQECLGGKEMVFIRHPTWATTNREQGGRRVASLLPVLHDKMGLLILDT